MHDCIRGNIRKIVLEMLKRTIRILTAGLSLTISLIPIIEYYYNIKELKNNNQSRKNRYEWYDVKI